MNMNDSTKTKNFQVLLYYKYIEIKDTEELKQHQLELCNKLNLKGRIIIAKEGINGTVEGTVVNTEKYIKELKVLVYFKDIRFKKSTGSGFAFPKLSIKVRSELVALHVSIDPNKIRGKYISADELQDWYKNRKDFVVVDMRNDYEYLSGYFENSKFSNIHNFFDLPKAISNLSSIKDKTVVTVCTGGVRCEKASGLLLENGFKEVYQLKDGIQTYIEKYPNQFFKGKLYVFDNRLTIGFKTDSVDHQIVGRCMHCSKSCDRYVNCAYDFCHYHYICCQECKDKQLNLAFCKYECKENYKKQHLKSN